MIRTVFDGEVDDFLKSEGASLKHFLEAYDIIVFDDFLDLLEPFFFIIVFICLDGRWPKKHVECQQRNSLPGGHFIY
jgi:hypothetical protein